MRTFTISQVAMVVGLMFLTGCGQSSSAQFGARAEPAALGLATVLLADEPDGALGVTELRGQAKDGDEVVLIGRIGGASKPWVEGRAAFAVVDTSIELCKGGVCACCKDKVCNATALVKVIDEYGHAIRTDARRLLNVKENELVVVAGKTKRDDAGNLTILASGVYIRR